MLWEVNQYPWKHRLAGDPNIPDGPDSPDGPVESGVGRPSLVVPAGRQESGQTDTSAQRHTDPPSPTTAGKSRSKSQFQNKGGGEIVDWWQDSRSLVLFGVYIIMYNNYIYLSISTTSHLLIFIIYIHRYHKPQTCDLFN